MRAGEQRKGLVIIKSGFSGRSDTKGFLELSC